MKKYKRRAFFEPEYHHLTNCLYEDTFNIDSDVDRLYELSGFDTFVENFNNGIISNKHKSNIFVKKDLKLNTLNSSIFKTKDCKKAHSINPVNIYCGVFEGGSFYNVGRINYTSDPYYIKISLKYEAISYQVLNNFNIDKLRYRDKKTIQNDISESRIKSTIYHELSHWLSDTLYNNHLTKLVTLSKELNKKDLLLLSNKNIDITYFEIDAQIHAIKNVKRLNDKKFKAKKWDDMTLTDLAYEYSVLKRIAMDLCSMYGKEVFEVWQKALVKRMNREKLLGKNMKDFIDVEYFLEESQKNRWRI